MQKNFLWLGLVLLPLLFVSCANAASGSDTSEDTPAETSTKNRWTWMSGSSEDNQSSVYGTQGVAAESNLPGARRLACSWVDSSDNLWMFGGDCYDGSKTYFPNDLWKYSPTTGLWTWVGGSTSNAPSGTYGTKGTASSGACPGGRSNASSWTDSSGNFWLFGGWHNTSGDYNDLWMYSPTTGLWTWVGGSSSPKQVGNYGTMGVAASTNMPGGRYGCALFVDGTGDVWVFGGYGYGTTATEGRLNDLWKYSPSTGLWTWVAGSDSINQTGVFGTQGTADSGNVPGSRCYTKGWIDASGNLMLFGGVGYGSAATTGYLNDLWKYSLSTGLWTWVGGSSSVRQAGVYGTLGVAASSNFPGAHAWPAVLVDGSTVWMVGGYGSGQTGIGYLDDIWTYSLKTGLWTWVGGSSSVNQIGVFGTKGTAADTNSPGGRYGTVSWIDSKGYLWIFGGSGRVTASTSTEAYRSDLWRYQP